MSGDIGIGRLIQGDAHRDAIHVAVLPATAGEQLRPGQRVTIDKNGKTAFGAPLVLVNNCPDPTVGIVDPFLYQPVEPGQDFYVFLLPGSITSLRHDWTHPVLDEQPLAKVWLENYAKFKGLRYDDMMALKNLPRDMPQAFWDNFQTVTGKDGQSTHTVMEVADAAGLGFAELMAGAADYQQNDRCLKEGGRWEGFDFDVEAFWDAYEKLTGAPVIDKSNFFSCAC